LRAVLGYAHADIVEEACVHVPVTSAMVGDDQLIHDLERRQQIAGVLERLASHVASGASHPS
jgi:hypothetical protein